MKPRPKNDLFVLCRNGCCRAAIAGAAISRPPTTEPSIPPCGIEIAACPLRVPPLRTRSVSTGLGMTKCRLRLQLLNVTPVRGEKGSCRRVFLPGKGLAGVKNRAAGGPPDERYYLRMPSFAMMAR